VLLCQSAENFVAGQKLITNLSCHSVDLRRL
jgi:hypothetical protein